MKLSAAYTIAGRMAQETKEDYAVIEYDYEETRTYGACPLTDCDYDEFIAFDGRIIEVIEP